MAKITLDPIVGSFASVTALNSRFQQIEDAFNNNVFYRLNIVGEPNSLSNDLDMGNNEIINLAAPAFNHSPARLQDVLDAATSMTSGTAVTTTLTDTGGFYASDNVEGALAEFGSTSTGEGASIIGIEDAGAYYAATDVEAALQELKGAGVTGTHTFSGVAASGSSSIDITHNLGTDNIIFGAVCYGSRSWLGGGSLTSVHMVSPNGASVYVISSTDAHPFVTVLPSSGDITIQGFNTDVNPQDIIVDYWIRVR